ncbi:MAG: helix-turn-helix transcriptional regulator [Gammaproteobacteria bacterium]
MDGSRIPSPRIHPLCAKAPEELVALTRAAWDGDAYRIAPGPFLFEGRRLSWGPRACTETWHCRGPVRARLTLVPMTVHVGFIEGEGLRVRGRTLPAAAMTVTVGGSTLDISTRDIASGLGVSIHAGTLDATLVAAWRARAEGETVLLPIEGGVVALRALLQRLDADPRAAAAEFGGEGGDGGGAASALVAAMQDALRDALPRQDLRLATGGRRRHALAAAAEQLIWDRVRAPEPGDTSLDALCTALGTTRRTLQLAFQEHFGVNFGLITRAARLQRVRDELRDGGASVSDTAFRHGFEHLGRFAGYYREFYGENPSATLRARAR